MSTAGLSLSQGHPLTEELASLRAAVTRFQDEAHASSIKLQRHALDTSALSDRIAQLETENGLLASELAVLRDNPAPASSETSAEIVAELTLSLRRLNGKLSLTETALEEHTRALAETTTLATQNTHSASEAYALAARSRGREEEGRQREAALERAVAQAQEETKLSDRVVEEYAALVRTLEGRSPLPSVTSFEHQSSGSSATLVENAAPTPKEALKDSKAQLATLAADFADRSAALEARIAAVEAERDVASAQLAAAHTLTAELGTELARAKFAAEQARVDDRSAAGMVERYMKFTQQTTTSLHTSLGALRARHEATLSTLQASLATLAKQLHDARATEVRLRAALDEAGGALVRETVGRRREVGVRVRMVGREERVVEGLKAALGRAELNLAGASDASLEEMQEAKALARLVKDVRTVLQSLDGEDERGTEGRMVLLENAVEMLVGELEEEVRKRVEAERGLREGSQSLENGHAEEKGLPPVPSTPGGLGAVEFPAGDVHVDAPSILAQPSIVEKEGRKTEVLPARPALEPSDPSLLCASQDGSPHEKTDEASEVGEVEVESEGNSIPANSEVSSTQAQEFEVEELVPESASGAEEVDARGQELDAVHANPKAQIEAAVDAGDTLPDAVDEEPVGSPHRAISVAKGPATPPPGSGPALSYVAEPVPVADVSFPSTDVDESPAPVVAFPSTSSVSHAEPESEHTLTTLSPPDANAKTLASPLPHPSQPREEPPQLAEAPPHPLLAQLAEAGKRYDQLQRAFRDCHLALQELRAALADSEPARDAFTLGQDADVLRTAVERLHDYTEDARVELEICVADGRVLARGFETIVLVDGHGDDAGEARAGGKHGDEHDAADVQRQIAVFVEREERSQAAFQRKLGDVEHDIAAVKSAVFAPPSAPVPLIPLPSPSTPERDHTGGGWTSWLRSSTSGGAGASGSGSGTRTPPSPGFGPGEAPTFGSVMTSPRLRHSASAARLAASASPSPKQRLMRREGVNPFEGLGLRVPMPAYVAPTPTPTAPAARQRTISGVYMLGLGVGQGGRRPNGLGTSSDRTNRALNEDGDGDVE